MDNKTFAFIYNLPNPSQALLWPNYYENDKELLDKDYEVTKEYHITNLGWSAWLANNQPYIVLVKKVTEFNGDTTPIVKSKSKKK